MPHVRQQIRDAAKTLLTGLTTTGVNVYTSRTWPLSDGQLPGLLIFTTDEQSEIGSMGKPPSIMRACELIVEGCAAVNGDLEDALDQICAEVETALGDDPRLGGLARYSFLRATQKSMRAEGELEYGAARMTFEVGYVTPQNDPTTTA